MAKAQALYLRGDSSGALTAADSAIRTNANDATAHYIKANCLMKAGRNSDAAAEYALAERLSPGSRLAAYCRDARSSLAGVSAGSTRRQSPGGPSSTKARVVEPEEEEESEAQVPDAKFGSAKGQKLPAGTLELIQKQTEIARKRALDVGAAEAENEIDKAKNQALSVRDRAEQMARTGGREPTAVSAQELSAMRAHAQEAGEQIKQQGQYRASIKEWEAQEKAHELQIQAENLQNRLIDDGPEREGAVKLNPVGTNLYTRNYVTVPITPLRAPEALDLYGRAHSSRSSVKLAGPQDKAAAGKLSLGKLNGLQSKAGGPAPEASIEKLPSGRSSVSSVKGQVVPNNK